MVDNGLVPIIIWGAFLLLLIILIVGIFWIYLVSKRNKDKGENGETE